MNYFDFYAGSTSRPATDVIEFDDVQVLEGELAEISNRIYLSRQERARLEINEGRR
jgi:hypothetical protein